MPWIAEVKKDIIIIDSHVFLRGKELYIVKKYPDNNVNKPWDVIAWKVGTDKTFSAFCITYKCAREVFHPPKWVKK